MGVYWTVGCRLQDVWTSCGHKLSAKCQHLVRMLHLSFYFYMYKKRVGYKRDLTESLEDDWICPAGCCQPKVSRSRGRGQVIVMQKRHITQQNMYLQSCSSPSLFLIFSQQKMGIFKTSFSSATKKRKRREISRCSHVTVTLREVEGDWLDGRRFILHPGGRRQIS